MPLKVEKRVFKDKSKSKTYWMRGTVKGREIFKSTKRTSKREAEAVANQLIAELDRQEDLSNKRLFFEAVESYKRKGKDLQYLPNINMALGMYPLDEIDQELIDQKAHETYPTQSDASRKRWFYDTTCTILNHAAEMGWCNYKKIRKPKVKRPPPKWAEFEWFDIIWKHCTPKLKALTAILSDCGCRCGEALALTPSHLNLDEKWAYIPLTKNGEPRTIYLTDLVVGFLRPILPKDEHGNIIPDARIFNWRDHRAVNTAIRRLVKRINKTRAEQNLQAIEYLSTHKFGSHTYGTMMRRYAGADDLTLTRTGRWKDARSVKIYSHTNIREEAPKAEIMSCARNKNRAKSEHGKVTK